MTEKQVELCSQLYSYETIFKDNEILGLFHSFLKEHQNHEQVECIVDLHELKEDLEKLNCDEGSNSTASPNSSNNSENNSPNPITSAGGVDINNQLSPTIQEEKMKKLLCKQRKINDVFKIVDSPSSSLPSSSYLNKNNEINNNNLDNNNMEDKVLVICQDESLPVITQSSSFGCDESQMCNEISSPIIRQQQQYNKQNDSEITPTIQKEMSPVKNVSPIFSKFSNNYTQSETNTKRNDHNNNTITISNIHGHERTSKAEEKKPIKHKRTTSLHLKTERTNNNNFNNNNNSTNNNSFTFDKTIERRRSRSSASEEDKSLVLLSQQQQQLSTNLFLYKCIVNKIKEIVGTYLEIGSTKELNLPKMFRVDITKRFKEMSIFIENLNEKEEHENKKKIDYHYYKWLETIDKLESFIHIQMKTESYKQFTKTAEFLNLVIERLLNNSNNNYNANNGNSNNNNSSGNNNLKEGNGLMKRFKLFEFLKSTNMEDDEDDMFHQLNGGGLSPKMMLANNNNVSNEDNDELSVSSATSAQDTTTSCLLSVEDETELENELLYAQNELYQWSVDQVIHWLQQQQDISSVQICKLFKKKKINGKKLVRLYKYIDRNDIPVLGLRKRLERKVNELLVEYGFEVLPSSSLESTNNNMNNSNNNNNNNNNNNTMIHFNNNNVLTSTTYSTSGVASLSPTTAVSPTTTSTTNTPPSMKRTVSTNATLVNLSSPKSPITATTTTTKTFHIGMFGRKKSSPEKKNLLSKQQQLEDEEEFFAKKNIAFNVDISKEIFHVKCYNVKDNEIKYLPFQAKHLVNYFTMRRLLSEAFSVPLHLIDIVVEYEHVDNTQHLIRKEIILQPTNIQDIFQMDIMKRLQECCQQPTCQQQQITTTNNNNNNHHHHLSTTSKKLYIRLHH
ncbi:hypothetical protein ABK040_010650 [Willaertia magna]